MERRFRHVSLRTMGPVHRIADNYFPRYSRDTLRPVLLLERRSSRSFSSDILSSCPPRLSAIYAFEILESHRDDLPLGEDSGERGWLSSSRAVISRNLPSKPSSDPLVEFHATRREGKCKLSSRSFQPAFEITFSFLFFIRIRDNVDSLGKQYRNVVLGRFSLERSMKRDSPLDKARSRGKESKRNPFSPAGSILRGAPAFDAAAFALGNRKRSCKGSSIHFPLPVPFSCPSFPELKDLAGTSFFSRPAFLLRVEARFLLNTYASICYTRIYIYICMHGTGC